MYISVVPPIFPNNLAGVTAEQTKEVATVLQYPIDAACKPIFSSCPHDLATYLHVFVHVQYKCYHVDKSKSRW